MRALPICNGWCRAACSGADKIGEHDFLGCSRPRPPEAARGAAERSPAANTVLDRYGCTGRCASGLDISASATLLRHAKTTAAA